jgi:hypothetical protein
MYQWRGYYSCLVMYVRNIYKYYVAYKLALEQAKLQ